MSKERLETNNNPPSSIWERLTPEEALNLGERILQQIEQGNFPENYTSLVDKLMRFAEDPEEFRASLPDNNQPNLKETNNLPQGSSPKNNENKKRHREGLSQLSPHERRKYEKQRKKRESIREAEKDGRPKIKNPRRKY